MIYWMCIFAFVSTVVAQSQQQIEPPHLTTKDPACADPAQTLRNCSEPARRYFLQRYEERKKAALTDIQWGKDLLLQCELEQSGRNCVIDFSKRCFPTTPHNQPTLVSAPECQVRINNITKGCATNSSLWASKCEDPLVAIIYRQITTSPTDASINSEKLQHFHNAVCCEIKRYDVCIKSKIATECKPNAQEVFRDILDNLFVVYRCDSRTAFANTNC